MSHKTLLPIKRPTCLKLVEKFCKQKFLRRRKLLVFLGEEKKDFPCVFPLLVGAFYRQFSSIAVMSS